uniref:Uncharacterized protein n=1 Tax=Caenorhabditis tropicalis TaxID=1561998 RepID=A0A1I7UPJ6_9PELO
MTKEEKPTDTKYASDRSLISSLISRLIHSISAFLFPLVLTPEKLVIPSSGHLNVQMKNPTNQSLEIECEFQSFGFNIERVWYMQVEAEIDVVWKAGKKFSYILKTDDVLHIKIKFEDKFDEKNYLIVDEKTKFGFLRVSCVSNFDSKTSKPKQEQSDCEEFYLRANIYFPLSIDPKCEKAKVLEEKYSERLLIQERKCKVFASRHSKEGWWICDECEEWGGCETEDKSRVDKWNYEILAKYGAKLDHMTIADISKIKEDMLKAYKKEEKEERRKRKDRK